MILNSSWLMLIIISTVLGLATQSYIKSTFRTWSQVPLRNGMTGAQVASQVLQANGIDADNTAIAQQVVQVGRPHVRIQAIGGSLSDNYDPRDKTLNLSEPVYASSTVAAAGVAAHEAGHAVQDAQGYIWGTLRSALVPAASFGSGAGIWMVIIGAVFLGSMPLGIGIAYVGIALFGFAVLFQIVTLPVELNASRRALTTLESTGMLDSEQLGGARKVLTAAALTYVAAALIAALQFLYYLGFLRRN
ncbi:MAG: zinc metallopeptidase [Coriobacteriia bacterium]|nr:zinc metallopeptidase [Coriobacteriia bacterium]